MFEVLFGGLFEGLFGGLLGGVFKGLLEGLSEEFGDTWCLEDLSSKKSMKLKPKINF